MMVGNIENLSEMHANNPFNTWDWLHPMLPKSPISELLRDLDWRTVYSIEHHRYRFEALIKERPFLMAQYRVQAAYLIQLSNQVNKNDPKLIQEIEKALKMTVLLKKIYHALEEPDDVMRAEIDIRILNTILHKIQKPHAESLCDIPHLNVGFGHRLRSVHTNTNLSRLTAIRIRRFILACMAQRFFTSWRPTVAQVELFTAPFFLYLGWMFFLPRLLLNLTTLAQKSFFAHKSKLPWSLRLEANLNLHRRLYELWTDSVWFTGGILLCFVLYGPLAVWRPLAILGVQTSDAVMMMTRSIVELRRLFILKKEYLHNIQNRVAPHNPGYLKALEERISFEKKVSYLAITNNVLMLTALLTLLPAIATLNPLLPVLGAILGLLTTLRFYTYNTANETQQPRTNLNLLLKKYDPKASALPASAPPSLLLNKLAVPAVLLLTPLAFLGCTINPLITALLCVSLAIMALRRAQQPIETQQSKKRYETTLRHQFFKPERATEQSAEPEQPKMARQATQG